MSGYVYIRTGAGYSVGFFKPDGNWEPETNFDTAAAAAARVHYLYGGTVELAAAAPALAPVAPADCRECKRGRLLVKEAALAVRVARAHCERQMITVHPLDAAVSKLDALTELMAEPGLDVVAVLGEIERWLVGSAQDQEGSGLILERALELKRQWGGGAL